MRIPVLLNLESNFKKSTQFQSVVQWKGIKNNNNFFVANIVEGYFASISKQWNENSQGLKWDSADLCSVSA